LGPGSLSGFRVTPRAQQDLEDIWRYSAETWSLDQADAYFDSLIQTIDTLVAMPLLARERSEFAPPVRIHPTGRHLIIYRIEPDGLLIIRVLGGRQDWQTVLARID
jgi:toxin ParE1/3/4